MNLPLKGPGACLFFLLLYGAGVTDAPGQGHLQKTVSISVTREPLSGTLQKIGLAGGFYFSYNSRHIPEDSLVTLNVTLTPVKEILDRLIGNKVKYRESGQYVILKPSETTERFAIVQGKVLDLESSKPVDFVSVYSKTTLISALTDESGAFRLRIREKALPLELTVGRMGYHDTSFFIGAPGAHQPAVFIRPKPLELQEVLVTNDPSFRKFLSGMLVSTRLKINNLNIGRFFADFPYQVSLSPGLGTHGRMSSRVVNKVSLNLLGGYTAGVDGLELAGGFNISTQDVRYVQVAGLFNVVNGSARGVQVAGVHNNLADSLSGIQVAGGLNTGRGIVRGAQVAGGVNRSAGPVSGIQLAGLVNDARQSVKGGQVSGFINRTKHRLNGLQIGVYNRAGYVKGLQIGIVNSADSTHGLSIGLLNFIKNSPSHFSVYHSDLAPFNLAWKTGSHKLYSIVTAGAGFAEGKKRYTVGLGIGHTFLLSPRWTLQSEAIAQNFYAGSFETMPDAFRLQALPGFKLTRRITLSGGPAITYLYSAGQISDGYAPLPGAVNRQLRLFGTNRLWMGWTAGINFYYGRFI